MKLHLLFILMDVATLMLIPLVYLLGKLRQLRKKLPVPSAFSDI